MKINLMGQNPQLTGFYLLRKIFAGFLLCMALSTFFGLQVVWSQTSQDAQSIEKTRIKVEKIGLGEKAKVKVTLKDNRILKGYISAANSDSFTVADSKNGSPETVSYADVKNVSKRSGGLSPLTWGIIGGVAAAAIIISVTVIKPVLCDGGAGC